ncbi:hypothetical protein V5O48_002356 [Marasmius crinis-equi]|uniref:Uncharacterized protein n=1 Tax=Marasmius crinis-equi TaxID=585013 RepID=A0ABR3FVV2_9AGAR
MRVTSKSISTKLPQVPHDQAQKTMSIFYSSFLSMYKRVPFIEEVSASRRRVYSAWDNDPENLRPANLLEVFAASTTAMAAVTLGANRGVKPPTPPSTPILEYGLYEYFNDKEGDGNNPRIGCEAWQEDLVVGNPWKHTKAPAVPSPAPENDNDVFFDCEDDDGTSLSGC